MPELKPIPIDDVREMLTPEDLETIGIGECSTVTMAESLLALAVDACDTTKNFASTVFEGKDGRLLVVTAKYTDGIPLEIEFSKTVRQRDALHTALKEIEPLARGILEITDDAIEELAAQIVARAIIGLAAIPESADD